MIQSLDAALTEKDVENLWRQKISSFFPDSIITSPYNTDGYLESSDGKISLLLEFKFQENLKSKLAQVTVLSQTLYYLKKFEKAGSKLPKVILIADKNECFMIHSNPLSKYLDYDLNWNVAASTAFKANPNLISDMVSDTDINPFVFDIVDGFNYSALKNKIIDLSENVKRLVKVTEHNINTVFEYFQSNVLGKNALTVNEVANLFINLIINPGENYLHPKRKNILITKSFGDVYVHTDKYVSFFSHFDGEQYSIREKEKLTAIVDRIVEDETRRRKGEFFTPTIWVDEAHKMICEAFGENWKDEYVVWDPACGTLNLTRDYKFKELYCSTIEESDLKTAEQMKYNPEAVKFQYDFLNDGIVDGKIDIEGDKKLPEGLKKALIEGKKIIVLMNPPYGTARSDKNISEGKSGISKNKLNDIMIDNSFGEASKNLYTQFIFKSLELSNNISICLFSPNLFLTSKSFEKFNSFVKSKLNICGGFMLDAGNFDGTSNWPINFTVLTKNKEYCNVFKVKSLNKESFQVEYLFEKVLEIIDGDRACDWIKLNSIKDEIYPNLSSALNTKNTSNRSNKNMISVLNNGGNRVEKNEKECSFLNGPYSGNTGVIVESTNFLKCTSLFASRKSIKQTWYNMKDEYYTPNESHPDWQQFKYDSVVYSIFNNRSYQSSLRQVSYKDKLWDIKNEFFWMSKEDMMNMAEKKYFDDLYRDARSSDERYVYKLLFKDGIYEKLSPDTKEVLDMATELVKTTFDMRKVLNDEHPEYHLNTWDAGWYQIKLILKQFYPEKLKEFSKKYKEFEDRMRPLVYELGFLRK